MQVWCVVPRDDRKELKPVPNDEVSEMPQYIQVGKLGTRDSYLNLMKMQWEFGDFDDSDSGSSPSSRSDSGHSDRSSNYKMIRHASRRRRVF